MKPVFVLNGPNLNMLGLREPAVYGSATLKDVEAACSEQARELDLDIDFRQTNSEGELVSWIHEARNVAAGIAINAGAYTHTSIALHDALKWMEGRGMLKGANPLKDHVAAVSCGIVAGNPVIDLDYVEDSGAQTDANFVITGSGGLVEVQGTAEGAPFSEEELLALLKLAKGGVGKLVALQKAAVA